MVGTALKNLALFIWTEAKTNKCEIESNTAEELLSIACRLWEQGLNGASFLCFLHYVIYCFNWSVEIVSVLSVG